jgi:hypothetical protein
MKIHSDILTASDIHAALRDAPNTQGVSLEYVEAKGSRSRNRSFEFRLVGTGNRRRNSGTHGASSSENLPAASWAQHGWFFAQIFHDDPKAIVGPYRGVEDFHAKTRGEFV